MFFLMLSLICHLSLKKIQDFLFFCWLTVTRLELYVKRHLMQAAANILLLSTVKKKDKWQTM